MHLNGGNCLKCPLKGKTLWKWADGLNINEYTPGAGLFPPRGNIHVYYHDIQRSSSLLPLGQSKQNFVWSIYRKGE